MRLLIFIGAILWITTTDADDATNDNNQGFILTGPKHLLVRTSEQFCVTVKDIAHSVANCTLDLIVDKAVIATANHQLNGNVTHYFNSTVSTGNRLIF